MANAPTLASTTDSAADIQAALATLDVDDPRGSFSAPVADAQDQPAPDPATAKDEAKAKADPVAPATAAEPAVVATPAETPAAPETADGDDEDAAAADATGKPRRSRARDRIDQLTRTTSTLERELAEQRRENESLRARASAPTPAVVAAAVDVVAAPALPAAVPEPKQEDFEDFDAYLKAHSKWNRDEGVRESVDAARAAAQKILDDRDAADRQRAIEADQQRQREVYTRRLDEARDTYNDFEAVMDAGRDLPVTPAMVEAITESPLSGHVLYFLNKRPAVCADIARMSPMTAAKEIGRLEGAISKWLREAKVATPAATETPAAQEKPAAARVAQPAVSKAPPPPAPMRGSSTNAGVPKEMSQITTLSEWERARGTAD
ncbi:MAG: hypothetical protein NUW22_07520 [Acidobacteria bacterium]|nr:hypothetical protein [Acidobacteriota bacterium]